MEQRQLNISFAKAGSGSKTTRLILPITWLRQMEISEENRTVNVTFDGNKIIIEKL